jgi:hypothetical protein
MASVLQVEELRGPTSGTNANKLIIPSGQTLDASGASFTGPPGTIVQTQVTRNNSINSGNPVNVWSEISSNYRVSITPKYSDSIIKLEYHIPINPQGATNILMAIAPWRSTNNGTTQTRLAQGDAVNLGSRHNLAVSWFRSNNGYDTNDMQNHVVIASETAGTTGTLTYGFHFRSEGSNTTYFAHSQGNNGTWGWMAPVTMIATEIKQ